MTGDGGLIALTVAEAKRIREYQLWVNADNLIGYWQPIDDELYRRLTSWIARHEPVGVDGD